MSDDKPKVSPFMEHFHRFLVSKVLGPEETPEYERCEHGNVGDPSGWLVCRQCLAARRAPDKASGSP